MAFQEILTHIIHEVEGSLGIGLVGLDGIVVAQVSMSKDFDLAVVGAEYATVVKEARRAFESIGVKDLQEILITTEKANMILVSCNNEFFVSFGITIDGNLGKGRLELKKAIPEITKEL